MSHGPGEWCEKCAVSAGNTSRPYLGYYRMNRDNGIVHTMTSVFSSFAREHWGGDEVSKCGVFVYDSREA